MTAGDPVATLSDVVVNVGTLDPFTGVLSLGVDPGQPPDIDLSYLSLSHVVKQTIDDRASRRERPADETTSAGQLGLDAPRLEEGSEESSDTPSDDAGDTSSEPTSDEPRVRDLLDASDSEPETAQMESPTARLAEFAASTAAGRDSLDDLDLSVASDRPEDSDAEWRAEGEGQERRRGSQESGSVPDRIEDAVTGERSHRESATPEAGDRRSVKPGSSDSGGDSASPSLDASQSTPRDSTSDPTAATSPADIQDATERPVADDLTMAADRQPPERGEASQGQGSSPDARDGRGHTDAQLSRHQSAPGTTSDPSDKHQESMQTPGSQGDATPTLTHERPRGRPNSGQSGPPEDASVDGRGTPRDTTARQSPDAQSGDSERPSVSAPPSLSFGENELTSPGRADTPRSTPGEDRRSQPGPSTRPDRGQPGPADGELSPEPEQPSRHEPDDESRDLSSASITDAIDVDRLAEKLYRELEDRMQVERERRGFR